MKQGMLDLGGETEATFTMACGEQPQRRMEDFGANALSDTELVAMLLQGSGTAAEWAVETASRLIAEAGSIQGLAAWAATDYRRIKGIGRMKGAQLTAMTEIARRMMAGGEMRPQLNRAEQIAAHFAPVVSGLAVYVELTIMWSARVAAAGCERKRGHRQLGIIARWAEGLTGLPLILC